MRQSQKKPKQNQFLDTLLWGLAFVLLAAAIWGNSYFGAVNVSLRIAGFIFLAFVLLGLLYLTQQGKKFWLFAKEARLELRKVVWPTRKETLQTALLILGIVALTTLILWGIDSLFAFLVSSILV